MHADRYVDGKGSFCQAPIFMLKEGMDPLERGAILKVDLDADATEEDVKVWAKRMGHEIVETEKAAGVTTIYIRKAGT